ncbi:MAG: hypothetical protein JST89_24445 [Cyanobacteria bacterium SZAS-4]|nr:hypothetical protein [Cyanobacteria bacterium SZAS-4]
MTDGTEMTLAALAKKIDEQARFTRSVSIICTLSILGVMFYTLTEMFSNLPNMIILQFMGNLEKINQEWKAIDNSQKTKVKPSAAAPAPATAAPVK